MHIVMVKWIDAAAYGDGWMRKHEIMHLTSTICVSIGILMKETEKEIKLIPNTNPTNVSLPIIIPKVCIQQIWKLKVSKKEV